MYMFDLIIIIAFQYARVRGETPIIFSLRCEQIYKTP